jgi:uncharacterized protein YjbJ (UPF0337 family)
MTKNNMVERGKANMEVLGGTIQEGVGHAIGNEKMEAEGAAHKVVGHARDEAAKAAEHTKGVIEQVVGTAKNKAGEILGDNSLKVEGKVEELTGKARQAVNK